MDFYPLIVGLCIGLIGAAAFTGSMLVLRGMRKLIVAQAEYHRSTIAYLDEVSRSFHLLSLTGDDTRRAYENITRLLVELQERERIQRIVDNLQGDTANVLFPLGMFRLQRTGHDDARLFITSNAQLQFMLTRIVVLVCDANTGASVSHGGVFVSVVKAGAEILFHASAPTSSDLFGVDEIGEVRFAAPRFAKRVPVGAMIEVGFAVPGALERDVIVSAVALGHTDEHQADVEFRRRDRARRLLRSPEVRRLLEALDETIDPIVPAGSSRFDVEPDGNVEGEDDDDDDGLEGILEECDPKLRRRRRYEGRELAGKLEEYATMRAMLMTLPFVRVVREQNDDDGAPDFVLVEIGSVAQRAMELEHFLVSAIGEDGNELRVREVRMRLESPIAGSLEVSLIAEMTSLESIRWGIPNTLFLGTTVSIQAGDRVVLEIKLNAPAAIGTPPGVQGVACGSGRVSAGGDSPRSASALGRETRGVGENEKSPETQPSGEVTETPGRTAGRRPVRPEGAPQADQAGEDRRLALHASGTLPASQARGPRRM